ncbi:unnamed protein product [Choristocarpus tenellus]|uniref:ribosomal protein L6 n=1 Tax=Choristocarpus tenellus TaxID=116065 RepID=UPI002E79B3B6|nr:ribosomal protein L6 [Choristocarpus tenellus]WBP69799.1 ribosomal protein L6 [Choristocarpus tenellus]
MLYRMIIRLPPGVYFINQNGKTILKGPQGNLILKLNFKAIQKKNVLFIIVSITNKEYCELIQALLGVGLSYYKELYLEGVGYRVIQKENTLIFELGYSHPISIFIPSKIKVKCVKNKLFLKSCDLQYLNRFCSYLRKFRFPDPYKGKGILYVGEKLIRKEGKI